MDQISEGGRSIHEIDKIRKRLEAEKMELQAALEHANAANAETQKVIKKYHQQIRDMQGKLEKEQRAKESDREALLTNERKANTAQNGLEEARTLLDQADRARRITEQELSDTNELLSNLTCNNQAIAGAKRKLESELATLQVDLDEMRREAGNSEEKSKKAMIDAARLADELRNEQETSAAFERERKLQECQVKDIQARLDDAEVNALKGGKKAMHKMESRIRELESEVDAEARRMADATKNLKASERHIKEISLKQSEDAENKAKMDKLIDSLHSKIENFKKQIGEAEEIASLNLTKYRQTQSQLADASQRADLNEKALAKTRASARSLL